VKDSWVASLIKDNMKPYYKRITDWINLSEDKRWSLLDSLEPEIGERHVT
jgi:hypothetical protein